jgi:type IV pilus assembly protein PilC
MISYQYEAVSKDGATVKGVIEAIDKYNAVDKIKTRYPVIISVEEIKETGFDRFLHMQLGKAFTTKELSLMCSQFKIILSSGVIIDECMRMISKQTKNKTLKTMLEKTADDVSHGASISKAMKANCPKLPVTFLETIRAGEISGNLEQSFTTLETYFEKSYKIEQKMSSVMTYPIFVIVVAVIVLAVIMTVVIPKLTAVFDELGGELPAPTKLLMGISDFFTQYWFVMAIVIILAVIIFKMYTHSEKGKTWWSQVMLTMPVLGHINVLRGAEQFADTMNALLVAGLPLAESIDVTSRVMDNYILSQEVHAMVEKIQTGSSLNECLSKSAYFPDILKEMAGVGEATGELEKTLGTMGVYYSSEADYAVGKAMSKIEPTMLIFLAVFAG